MAEWDESSWARAAASILGSPTQHCTLPIISPASRSSGAYNALARLGSVPPNSLTSLLTQPLARPLGSLTVPVYQTPAPAIVPPAWIYVTRRFKQIIENIGTQQPEIDDGLKKLGRLIGSLNRCYYPGEISEIAHSVVIGSWAKQTRVRPFSDIDVMFILPYDMYLRFESRAGNKQSQILQEMRANLKGSTYPRTEISGDRHVVIVEVDGVTIEVVPAILLQDGRYWVCDTNDGGRYKLADPAAELRALELATSSNDNARQLTRLLKKWQIQNDVLIKAFQLERLAIEFLGQWPYSAHDRFWYDWMMRDFFAYMVTRADGWVCMPGTGEWIALGSGWLGAAQRAGLNAAAACIYEQGNLESTAGKAWQNIFGNVAPEFVS